MVAFKSLTPRNLLVVGDLALDRYTHGKVGRISPEAPVPVLAAMKEEEMPGMAGNVALNLRALGQKVTLLSRVGNDRAAHVLIESLQKNGIQIALEGQEGFTTPIKHRLIASNQQIMRIDTEEITPLTQKALDAITKKLPSLFEGIDAVAISDYGKGFCAPTLLKALIAYAEEKAIPVLVDPKGRDFSRYRGSTLIKPNLSEAYLAAHLDANAPLDQVAAVLHSKTCIDTLLITRSEKGLTLFPQKGKREDIPSKPLQVRDVTGAGDTVLSILTCALANGLTVSSAARLANLAASLAVQRFGCAPISLTDLACLLCESAGNKLFDEDHVAALIEALKDTPYSLLDLSGEEALTFALFSRMQKMRAPGSKLVVHFDHEPHPVFVEILASLDPVDFILIGRHGLESLTPTTTYSVLK